MYFDWDVLPSMEVEIDAGQDKILQQGEGNEGHPEGSRHFWNQSDHDDDGS